MRALGGALVLSLLVGCASNGSIPSRTLPKVILGALVVGSAAVAIGSAVKSKKIQDDLTRDYSQRDISGSEFASRDSQGQRWNRIGRASAFVGGLSVLGLGILWEMSRADHAQAETPQTNPAPIFPVPAAMTLPPPRAGYMSASAR